MARENRRRGRTLAALLGLSALAGVAFLVGALAGLVWKEPSLLIAYLRGETTEVAWTTASTGVIPVIADAPSGEPVVPDPAEVRTPPTVAAPIPEPERTLSPTATAAVEPVIGDPAPPPAKVAPGVLAPEQPAVAAAPPGGQVAIQVGAFADRTAADRLRASLEAGGYPAYVIASAGNGSPWRVRIGRYATRDEAAEIAGLLKRTHKLPTWVLDEDAE